MGNRTAIITAASQGIGEACARKLSDLNYNLVLMSRSKKIISLAGELDCLALEGSVTEKDDLKKLQKELGLINKVEFIYKTNEQEKVALLEQSDLFIMPSIVYKKSIEGFGITFIEAASYGKASIGGIFGGESDAIVDGKTGYLCDGNDLSAIYEILIKALSNDNYKKLGDNAFEFSKNFDWNKIIKKYIELI